MLDCQLFDLNAGAHHLINVLFHIANTLLLFGVLKRMTGALWASAFVATIFALHPLHVESVAWVAERKDVLSTLFWMLTIWAYIGYYKHPKVTRYLLTLVLFILGLMAKPMLVTLPFVLLLLDYWPLERIAFDKRSGNARRSILHLLVEKVPFFGLSIVASVVTFLVQRSGGAIHTMEAFDLKRRAGNAIVCYVAYIIKMLWPSRLAVLYPHPGQNLSVAEVVACGLLLLVISFCLIYLGRRQKYLTVGWLWYVGTLVPVIGLVQVGVQARADRYTYIPLTGLFIIVAWGARQLLVKWSYRRIIPAALATVAVSAAAVLTSLQLRYWKNSFTLFEHALAVTTNNYTMHNNYANVLSDLGKFDQAIEQFNKSLKLRPNSAPVHNNLGNTLCKLGRIDEAIEHCSKAVKLEPDFSEAHYNLAIALAEKGNLDQAIVEYRQALRLAPHNVDALNNLGLIFAGQGKFDQAIEYFKKAIELEPNYIIAHGNLSLALVHLGKFDEAIKEFRIVLKARPDDAEMHCNLGIILERQGRTAEAIVEYRRALQINPNYTTVRERLQNVLKNKKTADKNSN
jgi:tetratricopeptide (TPR) repeat protein